MPRFPVLSFQIIALMGVTLLGASVLAGCGANSAIGSSSIAPQLNTTPGMLSGKLYGGPNPVAGSTITLYTTGSSYGSGASSVATTTTDSNGFFNLSLPTTSAVCTAGQYLYVTSYSGNTGALAANNNSLLMVPIGSCAANYSVTSVIDPVTSAVTYTNTYTGPSLWINEITTAISAYALSGFMTVSGSAVNIGAPANNTATYSSTSPSAGGLAHAFANALAIVNISTGQPYANFGNHAGGIIPDGEIFLIGNILQACVNSTGTSGTVTGTANDGTACGKLFSLTTPPVSGSATPTNTLGAMLNLAHYPALQGATWSSDCTASTGGTNTATTCLFGLAAASGSYAGGLTSAPPDWALAIVWPSGFGANTTATGCTTAGTCPGFTYPYYVATDYQDNVYVLNYSGSTTTYTNIIGVAPDGTAIFSSPKDTTNILVKMIGTDTAGHVFGANSSASPSNLLVWNTATGAEVTGSNAGGNFPLTAAADPFNNIYAASSQNAVNLRKYTYNGNATTPSYTVTSATTTAPSGGIVQMGFDSALDIYELSANSIAYLLVNTGTVSVPAYGTSPAAISTTVTGTTTNAFGMSATSANNLLTMTATTGVTPVTRNVSSTPATLTAGSPIAVTPVVSGGNYNRYMLTDGDDRAISIDGANGTAATGVDVVDVTHNLFLGTYKGCYVSGHVCGTTAGVVPMYSPRGQAIDSAGDIWVASGSSANLTALIGAAAPTWPGLSMAKSGRPQ